MTNLLRGIHPRLVSRAPDPRPSLALLSALRDQGDEVAWAVWYAVWRARGEADDSAARPGQGLDRLRAAVGRVPHLDEPLTAIAEYLHGVGTRRSAADALLRMSDWALERGIREPAIQCAEAAAALDPESGRVALAAGRMNRYFSEPQRAALFYERAITLSRLRRKWRTYVRAHLGLGQVKKGLGDPAGARAHYFTAARAARSLSGEKWLAAQTRHDLLVLAAELGVFTEALQHARNALEWYPRHHSSIPGLAHDIGFLLVRMHEYSRAVPLLKAAIPELVPLDQVIGWSTLARAHAGNAEQESYRLGAENTLRLVGLFDYHAAAAFANLACGAYELRLFQDAEQYALRSLEVSERRSQAEAVSVATSVLRRIRASSHAGPDQSVHPTDPAEIERLVAAAGERLATWRGPTWKRKRQSGREHLGRV